MDFACACGKRLSRPWLAFLITFMWLRLVNAFEGFKEPFDCHDRLSEAQGPFNLPLIVFARFPRQWCRGANMGPEIIAGSSWQRTFASPCVSWPCMAIYTHRHSSARSSNVVHPLWLPGLLVTMQPDLGSSLLTTARAQSVSLNLSIEHSCVCQIFAGVSCARLHDDLFCRDISYLKNKASKRKYQTNSLYQPLAQVSLYIAGFPCKAFSKLRAVSRWLEDKESKQFYKCAQTIHDVKPIAVWQHQVLQGLCYMNVTSK